MPRKSIAALSVAPSGPLDSARLIPPTDLSQEAQAVFRELVASAGSQHFIRSDLPLLAEYARAVVLARRAGEALEREGCVVAGKPSPWIVIHEKTTRALVSLSQRLRLSPMSRLDRRAAGRDTAARGPGFLDWKATDGD